MPDWLRIAHRGASGDFPENTRIAFAKAIEAGADMIELDCQLSRDGHVVVFHDEHLKRTAGSTGRVRDKTLEQLKKLDIGSWRNEMFKDERILTLEEVLQIIAGKIDLCIEIKSYPGASSDLEIKLLFIVSHYDYLDRTIFSSFAYSHLRRVRELAPQARIGVIHGSDGQGDPLNFAKEIGAGSIHLEKQLASPEFLINSRQAGVDVYVWTVNEVKEMKRFVSLGVQGLMSDFPERFGLLKG
jgi:glycerophosphoryl diester phosphodiesterase